MDNIENKEVFSQNLRFYMERAGKSQKEVSEIVGVATSTFNDWMKGKKYPRIDKVEMLANYFGILKSDLIEDKPKEYREAQAKNDVLADLIVKMRTDARFFSAVERLASLDNEKFNIIDQTLQAFTK